MRADTMRDVGRRGRWFLLTVGLSFGLPACALENPDHVEDSTGAETGWGCINGGCQTVRDTFSAPVPACEGEDTELAVGAGALAVLCAISRGPEGEDLVHETTCRPLVCRDSLDCPQWAGRTYGCIEEICQVEEVSGFMLDRLDLTALCLWDMPRHASCAQAASDPAVEARLARLDAVCDAEACSAIPEGCLEP
ncbi:MAG: hypothetical protein AB8I08_36465 [Sandaracinaceae bacterium]